MRTCRMTWHSIERARLAQALTEAGPQAPTLCEGWDAAHLAAHVVLREHSPVVGLGMAVPALSAHAERAIDELAASGSTEQGYRDLVSRVAAEPGRWHPMGWAGDLANHVELWVHTEDVRRGAGTAAPVELSDEQAAALWKDLLRMARVSYRRVPTGVVLVRADGVRKVVRRPSRGHGTVVVRGAVGELLLHAFGRGEAAEVTVEGAQADVDALRSVLPGG